MTAPSSPASQAPPFTSRRIYQAKPHHELNWSSRPLPVAWVTYRCIWGSGLMTVAYESNL
ncbi:uncharacterized protein BP01DRAFT_359076 [Aspergillus saccharolyticus JOP 1030-1]|uniref:Uncharacterized protein n=1 Tax=Aspergillus saccharolyticus JOP 1030-1 TaxID=1450539 RepID=A0A319A625_9EURO|nr:hypothetical protein BP01DRAFT_359076 [Aspergillus saccharolyticus JOP 1030-1]PYH42842.1 hypothetical protein BP01DRAFT_359076 [Aspergillus saccharolyticus JOP 1030-1]